MESSDDGLTWGSMVDITKTVVLPAWSFIGTGPPGGIQLPSGRLIICMTLSYYISVLYITSIGKYCSSGIVHMASCMKGVS
jgi:hypothetical protein